MNVIVHYYLAQWHTLRSGINEITQLKGIKYVNELFADLCRPLLFNFVCIPVKYVNRRPLYHLICFRIVKIPLEISFFLPPF